MTLEEIKSNMRTLNEDLDAIIIAQNFDETQWEQCASGIVNGILEDKAVKKILLDGTTEVRRDYLEAIKKGVIQGLEKMQEHSEELHDLGMTDKENAFNNVTIQSAQLADTIEKLEAVENDERDFVYSDKERIVDLENKIYYIDSTIAMKSDFEQLEKELTLGNGENAQNKSILLSQQMQKEFEKFEKDLKMINQLRKSENFFMKLLNEMNELAFNSAIDMTNEEQKNKIEEMIRLARLIDKVDYLDKGDQNKLKLSKPQYKDKNGNDVEPDEAVESWIGTINAKLAVEAKSKKLNLDCDFLDSREKIIRETFIESYKDSVVHKILTPEMHKKVLEEKDFEIEELKTSLTDLTERLKKYKFLSKKKPDELIKYKKEAEKLLGSYKTLMNGPKKISINGKVKQLQTDMTDVSNKFDAVDEIFKLDNTDEFKKEIESKAMILAGERPTDKWYHKFARFITFGIYKTPEQKYEIKLYGKRVEIVEGLISQNKQKIEEATMDVNYDKEAYKKTARKKVFDERTKKIEERKFDKKDVIKTRDNTKPLIR
ncbi:MAG: hypothetical protein ACI4UE_02375 [Candidatus Scatovivens sp.]